MSVNSCGPNCNYRKLYESSQISLSDMSAKQAGALARVGRLRAALISSIRKNFPAQSSEFEKAHGLRLSDMDDELILAFLEGLVSSHHSRDSKTTLLSLGNVLFSKGLINDISKPISWIDDIANFQKPLHNFNTELTTEIPTPEITHEHRGAPTETLSGIFAKAVKAPEGTPTQANVDNTLIERDKPLIEPVKPENNINEVLGWDVENIEKPPVVSLTDLFQINVDTTRDIDQKVNTNSWSPSPVKPELVSNYNPPGGKDRKTNKKREIRVQATPPKNQTVPSDLDLDDRLRGVFLAACTIPRPVFVKDLLSVCDSFDIVEKWEEESRANVDLGLRFISPKQRHRHRGSLVVPAKTLRLSTKKQAEDWWNAAIDLYMGSKLYELAVLLHRVGDEIVAYTFTESLAVLKVNTAKGIVTLITVMNDRLEKGSEARSALITAIENSAKERLAFIAVLTTLGEEKEMERLVHSLVEITSEEELGITCPLVCSKSWEYADNRGSTAIQITSD